MSTNVLYEHQRVVHPSKPVWFEREKYADGQWTCTPHYGTPAEPPRAHVSRGRYARPVWAPQ